jgi:hypothetical protein
MDDGRYYIENGRVVFTEKYHLERGYCCNSVGGCRHCPYKNKHNGSIEKTIRDTASGETNDELRQGCPHSRIEDEPIE